MSDPRLASLPAIRALAEQEARVRQDTLADLWPSMEDCPPPTWASMGTAEREFLIAVEAGLLADLTRPASRDAVARLVAERVGWDAFDVTRALEVSSHMLAGLYRQVGLGELPRWEPAPRPGEALLAIALHVLGAPDAP